MSDPSNVKEIFENYIDNSDEEFQKNILHTKIFKAWPEFAGSYIAREVTPIRISDKTLVLYSDNPAAKNTLMFIANEIADYFNENFGGGRKIIENVTFGKSFEKPVKFIKADKPKKKLPEQDLAAEIAKIKLTKKEIAAYQKNVARIENPEIREIAFNAHANFIRRKKFDIRSGKKKCALCDLFCEPGEVICKICKIHEQEKMRRGVSKILREIPWASYPEIQTEIAKNFPYTSRECTIDFIDSVRSAMVTELAAHIPYDDKDSLEVKFLAMLYKRIPADKLTEKVFNRAMKDLKFNMANLPEFKMRKFKKL